MVHLADKAAKRNEYHSLCNSNIMTIIGHLRMLFYSSHFGFWLGVQFCICFLKPLQIQCVSLILVSQIYHTLYISITPLMLSSLPGFIAMTICLQCKERCLIYIHVNTSLKVTYPMIQTDASIHPACMVPDIQDYNLPST